MGGLLLLRPATSAEAIWSCKRCKRGVLLGAGVTSVRLSASAVRAQ